MYTIVHNSGSFIARYLPVQPENNRAIRRSLKDNLLSTIARKRRQDRNQLREFKDCVRYIRRAD
jgi:hypothetical protein